MYTINLSTARYLRYKRWLTNVTITLVCVTLMTVSMVMMLQPREGETLDEAWWRDPPLPQELTIEGLLQMEKELRPDKRNSNSPLKAFTSDNKVHPKYFKYHQNELSTICINSQFSIFIYIHSAIQNFDRRKLLRQTWANPRILEKHNIGLIYILGTAPGNRTLRKQLQEENNKHHDILQIEYEDKYHDLSVKASAALNWVAHNCAPFVPFILKADDDVFIDVTLLMDYIQNDALRVMEQKRNDKLIFCHINFHNDVIRNPTSKWHISPSTYRKPFYPYFCPGMAILMTSLAVRHLRVSLNGSRVYPLDDVWLTAILPHNTGIELVPINKYYETAVDDINFIKSKWWIFLRRWRYMFVHCTPDNLLSLWHDVMNEF